MKQRITVPTPLPARLAYLLEGWHRPHRKRVASAYTTAALKKRPQKPQVVLTFAECKRRQGASCKDPSERFAGGGEEWARRNGVTKVQPTEAGMVELLRRTGGWKQARPDLRTATLNGTRGPERVARGPRYESPGARQDRPSA